MMVIARSLYDGFPLPYENAPGWYGISPDTAARGASRLAERGLLEIDTRYRKEPLSATGWTTANHFTLLPPLGPVGPRAVKASRNKKVARVEKTSKATRVRRLRPSVGRPPAGGG